MTDWINNSNTTQTTDDLWERTLQVLEKRISRQNIQTWFQAILGHHFADGKLTLMVPSKYYQDWISSHFMEEIISAVEELTNQRISVQFKIAEPRLASLKEDTPKIREELMVRPREEVGLSPRTAVTQENPTSPSRLTSFPPNDLYRRETSERSYLDSRYTFDTFVVGASNRFAQAAAVAVAQNPAKQYNPLFLYGGSGLGKTHLMHAIGNYVCKVNPQAKVVYFTSDGFLTAFITAVQTNRMLEFQAKFRNIDVLVVDDIQFIAGKEQTQVEFFHTFNALYEAQKQIVLSSDRSPKEISTIEERLRSRFGWGLIVDIQPPDFETRVAILKKKAYQERVSIPNDVTYYIAENITLNIRDLESCLTKIIATALIYGQPITLERAKEALHRQLDEKKEKNIDLVLIQKRVAAYYNITLEELCGQKRSKGIVQPRQVAMYLSRNLTNGSFPEIGDAFGKRDHSTVIHACNKIEREMDTDANFRRVVNHIIQQIKE
ncbi:MAG: chromosomal replication initiator protein DnaA [bacterium]|nr:chromosomal replication initiator protein DnaA [bacterium]